uniref:Secreted protein n=1 Tax=Arundo donax TaxID=35708 RepID=A0A0A8XP99_ARUDO
MNLCLGMHLLVPILLIELGLKLTNFNWSRSLFSPRLRPLVVLPVYQSSTSYHHYFFETNLPTIVAAQESTNFIAGTGKVHNTDDKTGAAGKHLHGF